MMQAERAWIDAFLPRHRPNPVVFDYLFNHNWNRWAIGIMPEVMYVDRGCWSLDIYVSIGPLHLSAGVMPGSKWPWR